MSQAKFVSTISYMYRLNRIAQQSPVQQQMKSPSRKRSQKKKNESHLENSLQGHHLVNNHLHQKRRALLIMKLRLVWRSWQRKKEKRMTKKSLYIVTDYFVIVVCFCCVLLCVYMYLYHSILAVAIVLHCEVWNSL